MQAYPFHIDSFCINILQHFLGKMQPCRRSSHRPSMHCIKCLITLIIAVYALPVEVWRYRYLSAMLQNGGKWQAFLPFKGHHNVRTVTRHHTRL